MIYTVRRISPMSGQIFIPSGSGLLRLGFERGEGRRPVGPQPALTREILAGLLRLVRKRYVSLSLGGMPRRKITGNIAFMV